jgi:hypothetical protein
MNSSMMKAAIIIYLRPAVSKKLNRAILVDIMPIIIQAMLLHDFIVRILKNCTN